ncbi:hypothetical protein [Vibrio phage BX-1]|nr:hypothetical protein [Vibrio phage BX-1]
MVFWSSFIKYWYKHMNKTMNVQFVSHEEEHSRLFSRFLWTYLNTSPNMIPATINGMQRTRNNTWRMKISYPDNRHIDLMLALDHLFILGRYMGEFSHIHKLVPGSEIRYYTDGERDSVEYAHERASVMTCLAIRQQERINMLEQIVKRQDESIMGLHSYFEELLGMGNLPNLLDDISQQLESLGGTALFEGSVSKELNRRKH